MLGVRLCYAQPMPRSATFLLVHAQPMHKPLIRSKLPNPMLDIVVGEPNNVPTSSTDRPWHLPMVPGNLHGVPLPYSSTYENFQTVSTRHQTCLRKHNANLLDLLVF